MQKRNANQTYVYPSYSAPPSPRPSNADIRFQTTTPLCAAAAAAVFEVGSEDASPSENTLGYLTCCVVVLFTDIQPFFLVVGVQVRLFFADGK